MQWTAETDQRLLLTILAKHNVNVDFEGVAEELGCTPRAVQERLKKLKKTAADGNTSSKERSGEGTPKKRRIAQPKSPRKIQKVQQGDSGIKSEQDEKKKSFNHKESWGEEIMKFEESDLKSGPNKGDT